MPYRSPARWVAPLSLVASLAAILVILGGGSGDDGERQQGGSATSTARPVGQATSAESPTTRRGERPSSYTVKAGDVLSVIAQRTGVSVQRLQELNPDIDAQTLRVGQRLKLRE